MVLKDVDPIDHTFLETVQFYERLELTKPHGQKYLSNNNSFSKSPVGTNNNKPNNSKQKTEENAVCFSGNTFCSLHGQGNHSSDECYAIKKMVKYHKASLKANQSSPNKKLEINELHAIIGQASRTSTILSLNSKTRNMKSRTNLSMKSKRPFNR